MTFISHESIYGCTWYEFERMAYRLLQHSGWRDLSFTSKSHDHGADIIGRPPGGRNFVVVQCKHTGSASVPAAGVNDLVRACDFYRTPLGVLVTNARLSPSGRRRMGELKHQYKFQFWGSDKLAGFGKKLPTDSLQKKTPRPYQQKAIDKVMNTFADGERRGLVTFATGLGKSVILAEVCREHIDRGEPVLLLAERVQLIEQLESDLWPQLTKNTPTRLWDGSRKPDEFTGLTVATQQSVLSHIRSGKELPHFGVVLVDECHHAASPTFLETLNRLSYSKLFGVTATPWRGDAAQLSQIFGPPIASMGIVEGIKLGYLADVDYTMFLDNIDWGVVHENSKAKLTIKDLNARLFLPSRDEDLARQVVEFWNKNGRPQTITFCRSIDHAERLAEVISSMGLQSKAIHSRDMPKAERAKLLMQFKMNEFNNFVAVDVLNEGIDVPDVGMVVFARVTHSRRIFVQQLGRGLRLSKDKTKVHVLDFVADVRRIAEGVRMNRESHDLYQKSEIYRGHGAKIVSFSRKGDSNFVDEYLADVADLKESDRVQLNFIED